jgi:DNA-binding beta-propeller fold protein YncE
MAIALSPDGRTLWTADTGATSITAYRTRGLARRHRIELHAAPLDIAVAPTGRTALVTMGFYDRPGLAIVDLVAGKVRHRAAPGKAVRAVAFAPDGRAYVATGGDEGSLVEVDPHTGHGRRAVDLGHDPRGLCFTPHGRHMLVALNGDAQVAVVALETLKVVGRIATAPFPSFVAAAPTGGRAVVSHNGYGSTSVSVLDVPRGKTVRVLSVGPDPAAVGFAGPGALLVAERGSGTVSVYDAHSGRRRHHITTGGWPRAIALRGRRAFVADEQTGQLHSFGI